MSYLFSQPSSIESELCNNKLIIWATVSSRSWFCWLYSQNVRHDVYGNVNWYDHSGKQYEICFKNRAIIWSSNLTPGRVPKENHNSKRHMQPNVHCTAITIVRPWRQREYPWIEECIKKMWCLFSMEYYSSVKRN